MKRATLFLMTMILAAGLAAATKKRPSYDASLPKVGTTFHTLPAGSGRQLAEASCLPCHSADMVAQQRLTEKQWTATVEKMMRWGAVVSDADKPALIAYLARNFGPANRFTPIRTRPAGF